MPINLIDQKIRQAFSDASIQYDVLTGLHKEIGRELVDKIKTHEPSGHILDVGMGTGWLTTRLTYFFPDSTIVGMDFAPGMIAWAKKYNEGFRIVEGDARAMPFKPNSFNIIASNLSYQWVKDLPSAFKLCHELLQPDGLMAFNLFGYKTFDELFISMENSIDRRNKEEQIIFRRLASLEEVQSALETAGFKDIKMEQEFIKVHFPDMMSLLKWIKDIGANQIERDIFIGKDLIKKAADYYNQNHRDRLGIVATFEVIWAQAIK